MTSSFLRSGDASTVAAFIFEPIVGATLGAASGVDATPRIAEICRPHGILLIADEVNERHGAARENLRQPATGASSPTLFYWEGSPAVTLPRAVLALPIVDAFKSTAAFMHGFTINPIPFPPAAGNPVFDYSKLTNFRSASGLRERSANLSLLSSPIPTWPGGLAIAGRRIR